MKNEEVNEMIFKLTIMNVLELDLETSYGHSNLDMIFILSVKDVMTALGRRLFLRDVRGIIITWKVNFVLGK